MKKLMIAAAMAACATVGLAGDEITSANIVGYISKELQPNTWYLIANNFEATAGGDIDVQDFATGLTAASGTTCPVMQYWDGSKLKTLYYMNSQYDEELDDDITGWGTGSDASHKKFAPGEGCWVKVRSAAAQTVTTAGQVVGLTEKEVALTTSWQLIGNPFPVSFTLNKSGLDCSSLTPSGSSNCPVMQYWDGSKLKTLYYMNNQYDEDLDDDITGWGTGADAVNREFPPCTGFYIKIRTGTGTIKFTR